MRAARRIAFFSTVRAFGFGAPDRFWTRAAAALLRSGDRVWIAVSRQARGHPVLAALGARGAVTRTVPSVGPGGRLQTAKRMFHDWRCGARGTMESLRAFQPDVVVINQGGFADFMLEDELRDFLLSRSIPYVVICHSNQADAAWSESDRALAAEFLGGAHRVLANSGYVLDLGRKQLRAALPRGEIFQNPVDLPPDVPLPWPDTPRAAFAFVGRLDAYGKGLDLLLRSLARAPGPGQSWRLNLYGAGPDRRELETLAGTLGLSPQITFHGHISNLAAIWSENHILLLPSRIEGFGLVMLEALACGRPVLRTNLGGAAEWMRDGINGFICPSPTEADVTATLARAWSQRQSWREMGLQAAEVIPRIDPAPERTLMAAIDLLPTPPAVR